MAAQRDFRPIAHGTWDLRSRPRDLQPPDRGQFQPVDVRPETTPGVNRALRHQKAQKQILDRSGPPVMVIGQYVAQVAQDLHKDRKREKAASTPHHSVKEAATAAVAYRRSVIAYCLAGSVLPEGRDADAHLVSLVPAAAEPLRRLGAATDLRDSELMSWSAAVGLTNPLFEAAQELHALVAPAFRAVPAKASLPWISTRITSRQRARALRDAVEAVDRQIAAWYEFLFVGNAPADPLKAVVAELKVGEAAEKFSGARRRCRSLADGSSSPGLSAQPPLRNWRTL